MDSKKGEDRESGGLRGQGSGPLQNQLGVVGSHLPGHLLSGVAGVVECPQDLSGVRGAHVTDRTLLVVLAGLFLRWLASLELDAEDPKAQKLLELWAEETEPKEPAPSQ